MWFNLVPQRIHQKLQSLILESAISIKFFEFLVHNNNYVGDGLLLV